MKAKSLLLTSVMGAVVVGGALTGVTVASFSGSAPFPAETVQTGSLAIEAGPVLGSVGALAPGTSGQAAVTLSEIAEGKNLWTRRVIDGVAVAGLPSDALRIEFRERRPNDQTACASNGFKEWPAASTGQGLRRHLVLGTRGRPSSSSEVCIRVTLREDAKNLLGVGRRSGTIQVTFASQQVQGDEIAGWEASTGPVVIPVSTSIAPSAPAAKCEIDRDWRDWLKRYLLLTWPEVPGATSYRVYRQDTDVPVLIKEGISGSEPSARIYRHYDLGGNPDAEFVVRAVADGLEGPPSNGIRTWDDDARWKCRS